VKGDGVKRPAAVVFFSGVGFFLVVFFGGLKVSEAQFSRIAAVCEQKIDFATQMFRSIELVIESRIKESNKLTLEVVQIDKFVCSRWRDKGLMIVCTAVAGRCALVGRESCDRAVDE
jgi:hypothetical protein